MKVHVHVHVLQIYAEYLEVRRTDAVAQTADALCRTAKLELKPQRPDGGFRAQVCAGGVPKGLATRLPSRRGSRSATRGGGSAPFRVASWHAAWA